MTDKSGRTWADAATEVYRDSIKGRVVAWGKKLNNREYPENLRNEKLAIENQNEPVLSLPNYSSRLISYNEYSRKRGITVASRLKLRD